MWKNEGLWLRLRDNLLIQYPLKSMELCLNSSRSHPLSSRHFKGNKPKCVCFARSKDVIAIQVAVYTLNQGNFLVKSIWHWARPFAVDNFLDRNQEVKPCVCLCSSNTTQFHLDIPVSPPSLFHKSDCFFFRLLPALLYWSLRAQKNKNGY